MISNLSNLEHCLKKAGKWAEENKIEESKLVEGKLAPDMFALAKQIYSCTNGSKFLLKRVLGTEVPVWEDNETTIEQFCTRIEKAIAILKTADEKAFEGKEDTPVSFKAGGHELKYTGLTYIQYFGLPNFFFHVVTAYDILRNAGAPIGKLDFLRGDN